ncbi:MAG: hypothetical protein HYT15_04445 [Candidatus Magasanikbacteria bacterium]|nr:hypothetical protein [Candidatus Magasanikbacteria bacterium]
MEETPRRSGRNAKNLPIFLIFGLVLLFAIIGFVSNKANAAVAPSIITYQGKLLISNRLATTSQNMYFILYDASSGGNVLYTASGTIGTPVAVSTTPSQGLFSINLGDTGTNSLEPAIFQNNSSVYLEVRIGSDTLTPRKRITATPYAFNSKYLDGYGVNTLSTTPYIPRSDSSGNFTFNSTTVSTSTILGSLNVFGGSSFATITAGIWNGTVISSTYGGTGQNSQAWTGLVRVTAGNWATSTVNLASASDVTGVLSIANGGTNSSTLAANGSVIYSDGTRYNATEVGTLGYLLMSAGAGRPVWINSTTFGTGTISSGTAGQFSYYASSGATLVGTSTLFILPTSLIGIGTSTPQAKLTIQGTGSANPFSILTSTAAASSMFTVLTNGRVGINSSSPIASLALQGTAGVNPFDITSSTGASLLRINTNGNVGIGTTTPAQRLSVVGNISNITDVSTTISKVASTTMEVGAWFPFVSGRYVYMTNFDSGSLSIIDVSDPSSPTHVASTSIGNTGSNPASVYISGRYAYTANQGEDSMSIVDISNPSSPRQVATTSVGTGPRSIYISGQYAYIANYGGDSVSVVDISNPLRPTKVATTTMEGLGPYSIYVSGRYAYTANYGGGSISVIDISNPLNPVRIATTSLGTNPSSISVSGRYAYVVNSGSETISVVDVKNPAAPVPVATSSVIAGIFSIHISGRYGYTANTTDNSISIVDFSNPLAPAVLNTFLGAGFNYPSYVFVSGRYLYMANYQSNGLIVLDISGTEVTSLIAHSAEVGNIQSRNDIFAQGNVMVGTSLFVGAGGIQSQGALSVFASSTGATSSIFNIGSVQTPYIFRALANGRIGIGTSTLSAKFTIQGSGTENPFSIVSSSAAASSMFTILTNGRVGINSSSPIASLALQGTAGVNPFSINSSTGASLLSILTNGRVGINSSSPIATLSVQGDLALTGGIYDSVSSLGVNGYLLQSNGSVVTWVSTSSLGIGGSGTVSSGTAGQFSYYASNGTTLVGTSTLFILPTSLIGIGTTTPQAKLTIQGTGTANPFSVVSSTAAATSMFTILTNGNVGISTSTPAQKLSVVGNISNITDPSTAVSVVGTGSVGSNPLGIFVSGKYAYTANQVENSISIVDVSNPAYPRFVASTSVGTNPNDLYISGRYAYVTNGNGANVSIVDISNPSAPRQVSTITVGGGPKSPYVSGRYLYVVNGSATTMTIIDISNPLSPVRISTTTVGSQPNGVFVSGRFAYTANYNEASVSVIDVSDPQAPVFIASTSVGTGPASIYVSGRYAYTANDAANTVSVVDISSSSNPVTVGTVSAGDPTDIYVSGRYAYVANSASTNMSIIDVASSTNPALLTSVTVGSAPKSVYVSGRYAYTANYTSSNFSIIDISGTEVTSLIAHSAEVGNIQSRNDVFAQGNIMAGTSLNVGAGGIFSQGGLSIFASSTGSTSSIFSIDSAASSSIIKVLSNGNIGIGTSTPTNALTIGGNGALSIGNVPATAGAIRLSTNTGINIRNAANTGDLNLISLNSSNQTIVGNSTGATLFGSDVGFSTDNTFDIGGGTRNPRYIFAKTGIFVGTTTIQSASLAVQGSGSVNPFSVVTNTAAASSMFTILTNGRVGINSSSPVASLALQGTAGTNPFAVVSSSGADLFRILTNGDIVHSTASDSAIVNLVNSAGGVEIYGQGDNGFNINSDNSIFMRIDANGNGINEFQVLNGSNNTVFNIGEAPYFGFNTTSANAFITMQAAASGNPILDIVSSSPSTNIFRINANGNVGVGTTTPTQKLSVVGNISNITDANTVISRISTTSVENSPQSIFVSGRYAYVGNYNSSTISVVDISNPAAPVQIATTSVGTNPRSIFVSGRYAYTVNQGSNNISIIDISNAAVPRQISTVAVGSSPRSIYVSGRYAYVANFTSDSMSVVDISNPLAPVQIATTSVGDGANSVYVSGQYAYVTNFSANTVSVVDISNPSIPVQVSSTVVDARPMSIYVSGRYAYTANDTSDSISVIDISNASAPTQIATTSVGASSGPASIFVSGRYAYVANQSNQTIAVVDVSSSSAPTLITTLALGTNAGSNSIFVSGRYLYAVSSGLNSMFVIDISGTEVTSLIAHSAEVGNIQSRNDIFAQGNIMAGTGLNVGTGGIMSQGSISVFASSTGASSSLFSIDTAERSNILKVVANGRVGINTSTPVASFALTGQGGVPLINIVTSSVSVLSTDSIGDLTLKSSGGSHSFQFSESAGLIFTSSFGKYFFAGTNPYIRAYTNTGMGVAGNLATNLSGVSVFFNDDNQRQATSGTSTMAQVRGTFNPGSGTGNFIGLDVAPTVSTSPSYNGQYISALRVSPLVTAMSSTNAYLFDVGTNALANGAGNHTSLFVIDKNGRVGINTTSPIATLALQGTGSADPVEIASSTGASLFRVLTNGDVGVMTGNLGVRVTTPSELIHARLDQSAQSGLRIDNNNSGSSASAGFDFRNGGLGTDDRVLLLTAGTGYTAVTGWQDAGILSSQSNISGGLVFNANAGGIKFETGGNGSAFQKMAITNAGRVGIGTTTPLAFFTIAASSTNGGNSIFEVASSSGASYLRILHDGRIGINTTSPIASLALQGAASANPLEIASSTGSSMFRILQNGNVGIGTDAPNADLQVGNTTETQGLIAITAATNGTSDIFFDTTAQNRGVIRYTFAGGSQLSADSMAFWTAGTERIRIDALGRVGINTTSQRATFNIFSTPTSTPLFDIASSTGASMLRVLANGNIGVNSSSPVSIFSVVGTSTFDGNVLPNASPTAGASTQVTTTIDSAGDQGSYSSIAIGADGLPVISYYNVTDLDLRVVKCGNASCSSGNVTTTIDSAGDQGSNSSIAIGADGLPVISYYNATNGDLRVAKCGNASCSSGNVTTTIDSTGDQGQETSIAIGTDGLPVISYYNVTDLDLRVAKCGNASCSSGNVTTTIDSTGSQGTDTSIAIGTDGLPVISYYNATNGDLRVAKCGNASCSSGNVTTTIDSTGDQGQDTSIAIGTDGLPVISYYNGTDGDLRVVKCGNSFCSSGNVTTTIDSAGDQGQLSSIAIGTDGLPVISYYNGTDLDLRVAKCGNASCSSGNVTTTIDSTGNQGQFTSIAIGTDGLPVISYYNVTDLDLRAAKCATPGCKNTTGGSFTGGSNIGSLGAFFMNVYANSFWGKQFQIEGFDLAESYRVDDLSITAGDLVRIATSSSGVRPTVEKTTGAYDGVVGVISTNPGIRLSDWTSSEDGRLVTLSGRVPTKVSDENGPILAGDPIAASSLPGVGMKAKKDGVIVGRALESFAGSGTGVIEVFISPSWAPGQSPLTIDTTSSTITVGDSTNPFDLIISGNISFANNSIVNKLSFATSTLFESNVGSFAGSRAFTFNAANFTSPLADNYIISLRANNNSVFSVAANGDVHTSGNYYGASAVLGTSTNPGDLAERVDIAIDDTAEAGDVMMVDPNSPDTYRRSNSAYEQSVAGVISTNPTIVVGNGKTDYTAVLAMVGRVPVKVSAENGAIARGDLLVSASTAGFAMKYDPTKDKNNKVVGIIGVALEPLPASSTGKILALIRTGWVYNRDKDIDNLHNNIEQLAIAQGINLSPGANPGTLSVESNNNQLVYSGGNLDLQNNSIINVAGIIGKDDKWKIDEFGNLIQKITTAVGDKEIYGLQSAGKQEIVISGTSTLENGTRRVVLTDLDQAIIDRSVPLNIQITMSGDTKGVYVSERNYDSFVVKENENGQSNAAFDWTVIAKVLQPEEVVPEAINESSGGAGIPETPEVSQESPSSTTSTTTDPSTSTVSETIEPVASSTEPVVLEQPPAENIVNTSTAAE